MREEARRGEGWVIKRRGAQVTCTQTHLASPSSSSTRFAWLDGTGLDWGLEWTAATGHCYSRTPARTPAHRRLRTTPPRSLNSTDSRMSATLARTPRQPLAEVHILNDHHGDADPDGGARLAWAEVQALVEDFELEGPFTPTLAPRETESNRALTILLPSPRARTHRSRLVPPHAHHLAHHGARVPRAPLQRLARVPRPAREGHAPRALRPRLCERRRDSAQGRRRGRLARQEQRQRRPRRPRRQRRVGADEREEEVPSTMPGLLARKRKQTRTDGSLSRCTGNASCRSRRVKTVTVSSRFYCLVSSLRSLPSGPSPASLLRLCPPSVLYKRTTSASSTTSLFWNQSSCFCPRSPLAVFPSSSSSAHNHPLTRHRLSLVASSPYQASAQRSN